MKRLLLPLALLLGCPTPADDDSANPGDDDTSAPSYCQTLGLPEHAWDPSAPPETNFHRRDLAPDLTLELLDEDPFVLSAAWTGCDNFVFLPDGHRRSALDATDLWEDEEAILEILRESPRNVHWFFYSQKGDAEAAEDMLEPMADRVRDVLETLAAEDGDAGQWWTGRVHVVRARAERWDNWAEEAESAHGAFGFGIDRQQVIRDVGSFSDVRFYNPNLADWPWANSLSMARHEPAAWNHWASEQERMDATPATTVTLWSGETLAEFADTTVELPPAAEMADWNRMEIVVRQACPDADAPEAGNCGAWDYLAYLFVQEGENWTQLGRFITAYHRETDWVVDASQLLPMLADGGTRTFRWSFAPSWNTQPTRTWLELRFWSDGGVQAQELTPLWTGGSWNADYNANHPPIQIAIPADAAKVELFVILTGHGMDAPHNCAEFCEHRHVFTVDGDVFEKSHDTVGDDEGCIGQKDHGMAPNQWGTWWFGRGGWCPGEQVDPWVVDLSGVVTPGGTAELSYEMFLGQASPSGSAVWGNIDLASWLVVSR